MNSFLWPTFRQSNLDTKVRMQPEELDFVEWLIRLGDGRLTNDYELGKDIIEILPECLVQDSIVDDIFGSSEIDLDRLSVRAILCTKNEDSLDSCFVNPIKPAKAKKILSLNPNVYPLTAEQRG